jgi:mono/diheme cytochrome c family protein
MNVHRGVGYAYAILYVVMMVQMVPRLWTYQVEFPARTVAHIMLGITIGVILLVKISILRWFRHFEEWMPVLGVAMLLCTFLLTGLSVPFVLKERALAAAAVGGDVYSAENRARVARLLPEAGFPPEAPLAELSTEPALRDGREVLLSKCVECHDLKTVISKPPLGSVITEPDMYRVSAYLIAITPDLQRSAKKKREQVMAQAEARAAVEAPAAPAPAFDHERARSTFEKVCSQCHELSDVDEEPPTSADEARALIARMVDENGLEASKEELALVEGWLNEKYVKK